MALTLTENDFDFYLRFAKPLVLNLSEPDDRALSAAWIQKLRDENVGDLRLRTDYLKLLLFVLQRNKLIGTFLQNPNTFEKLDEFPETQLKDIAKELLESDAELRKKKRKEGGDYPPYAAEHSADLLEYAAAQEIPKFGVHAYYAISNDPLPLWDRTENVIFPRGAFSATDQNANSFQQGQVVDTLSEPTLAQKKVQFKFESKSKIKPPTRYSPFQSQQRSSPRNEPSREERTPLTWGSNLIGVTEPVPHEYLPVSVVNEDSDEGIVSNRSYYSPERQTQNADYSGRGPIEQQQNAIASEDFEPFDTMLEEYDRDEPISGASFVSNEIPKSACAPSRVPVARTSRIPHQNGRQRKPPLDEVDLFHLNTQQRSAYSPQLPEEGTQPLFSETPPSFINDSTLPSIESLEDPSLPLRTPSPRRAQQFASTPQRQIYSPALSEGQEVPFYLESPRRPQRKTPQEFLYYSELPNGEVDPLFSETPPSFLNDSTLPSIDALEDPSLPLRTPSPRRQQRRTPQGVLYYPALPKGEVDPLFSETPPSFIDDYSLSSIDALEDPSLPLRTPSPRRQETRTPQGYLYYPELPKGEVDPLFSETSPSFIDDYNLPSIDALEDPSLPLRTPSPRRPQTRTPQGVLYYPALPKGEVDPLLSETPPSFIDDSDLPSIDALEDPSLPLRTPSPRRPKGLTSSPEWALYSPKLPIKKREEFFVETPSNEPYLDAFHDISLPLQTPPRPRPTTTEDSSLESLPYFTTPPYPYNDYSLPIKTPSPQKRQTLLNTPKKYEYFDQLPEGEAEPFYLETPPSFMNNSTLSSIDALEEPSLPLQTPPRPSPNNLSRRTPQSFRLADEEEGLGTLQDISFPVRTPSPRRPKHDTDLLEALGLSANQLQIDSEDVSKSKLEESEELNSVLVTAGSSAAQDIIDDFNQQNTSQYQSQANVKRPKRGIPRRVVPPRSATSSQIPQFQKTRQYQPLVQKSELDVNERRCMIPKRSLIARPKRRLVFEPKNKVEPQSPQRQVSPQPPTLDQNQPYVVAATNLSRRSPEQKTPSLESEPKTPSPRRLNNNGSDTLFTLGASESFLQLGLESPPQEYENADFPMSPNDSFGLPRPIRVADLPPIIHSPFQYVESPPVSPIVQQKPKTISTRATEAGTSSRISELTTDSLPERVSRQVEIMLKKLEEPFEKKWTLPEIPEQAPDILEESFEFPTSPEASSPVREFRFSPGAQIQSEIDYMLTQTPPIASPSPPRNRQRESHLFQPTDEDSYAQLASETPPRMDYASPKTLPDEYQSPSAFFAQTPPMKEFQYSEFVGSPESPELPVAEEIFSSPDSPVESPRALRSRLRQVPFSAYGKRDRILVAPTVSTLRELFEQEEEPIEPEPTYTDSSYPAEGVQGWITPPQYKRVPIPKHRKLQEINLVSRSKPEDLIDDEEFPEDVLHSPAPLTPDELQQFTEQLDNMIDQNMIGTNRMPLPSSENIVDEEFPNYVMQSPPPLSLEELKDLRLKNEINIEEEEFPDDIMHSPPPLSPQLKTPSTKKPYQPRASPTSPFRGMTPPRIPPITPYSPNESPIALRIRMYQAEEPPYYSRRNMRVMTGKTSGKKVIVRKGLKAPKHYTLREETEGYSDEHVPFRSQVESAKSKFTKQRKRTKMLKATMEDIRESPIKVPYMTEVEDPTGFRIERERLEQRFSHLPELDYQFPEDLYGTSAFLPEEKRKATVLDTTPPRNLPNPLMPSAEVPGWKTPPQYKHTQPKRLQLREVTEIMKIPQNNLAEELIPAEVLYSPPQISSAEREKLKASITASQRNPFELSTPPKRVRSPKLEERQRTRPHQKSLFEMTDLLSDTILDDELLPDDILPVSPTQRTPTRRVRSPQSPISSPESPIDFRIRLYQGDEPPYYSKSSMSVIVGTGKRVRVKRHSRSPKVHKLRELPEEYSEEHVPFLSQVESAGKLPPKRRKRIQRRIAMGSLREVPMNVPNWFEVDDLTGFRRIREELEARCADLPELPVVYPENLIGSTIVGEWDQEFTELDTGLPENLPTPLRPINKVPGWETPPRLRPTKTPTRTTEDFKFKLKPELRDVLYYEMLPKDLDYSPPPQSPKTPKTQRPSPKRPTPPLNFEQLGEKFAALDMLDLEVLNEDYLDYGSPTSPSLPQEHLLHQQTHKERSPKANVSLQNPRMTFEQLEDKAARSPEILDFETLAEDYLQYESPTTPTSPRKNLARLSKVNRTKTLSFADKYLAREATRAALAQLQEESNSAVQQEHELEQRQQAQESIKKPTFYERIEELIYDVPDSHMPMPPPVVTPKLLKFLSPPWSPKLPNTSRFIDTIDIDYVPEEILNYGSPKTPQASPPKRSPVMPEAKQAISPKPLARNLFDEFNENEELLDVEDFPEEPLISSPQTPETPPTPPRLEDFYNVEQSPKLLESPDYFSERVKQHRYTPHRYDTNRRMMTKAVQIKNRRVPVRKSKPPKVSTIQESDQEGTNVPSTRLFKDEIIEVEQIPSMFPDFTPRKIEFASPPKLEKVKIPPKYVYTKPVYTDGVYGVSPPKWAPEPIVEYDEIYDFPEFPPIEHIPIEFSRQSQVPDYALPRPIYFASPGREYIRTPVRNRPYYDFDDAPAESTRNVASPRQIYSNRQHTAPRMTESITVTEYGEPFEDFDLVYDPDVLDTSPIQVVEDEGAAGYYSSYS